MGRCYWCSMISQVAHDDGMLVAMLTPHSSIHCMHILGEVIGTSDEVPEPISYSRRSPFPVINILRAPMVRQAQRGTEQGKVFSDNIDRLNRVGRRNLQRMLDERDWTALPKLSAHHRPAVPKIDAASPSVSIPDEPADTTCQRDDAPMVEEDIMLMVDNWLQEQSSK